MESLAEQLAHATSWLLEELKHNSLDHIQSLREPMMEIAALIQKIREEEPYLG